MEYVDSLVMFKNYNIWGCFCFRDGVVLNYYYNYFYNVVLFKVEVVLFVIKEGFEI